MKTEQWKWTPESGWNRLSSTVLNQDAQLVLLFGDTSHLMNVRARNELIKRYSNAIIIGCSTAGDILGGRVHTDAMTATAVRFQSTDVNGMAMRLMPGDDGYRAGKKLAHALARKGLTHVLLFADGMRVDGSALARALNESFSPAIGISGGLAGDALRFQETCVVWGKFVQREVIAAVGLSSLRLVTGIATRGGWESFGDEMRITASKGNVLYTLNGEPALPFVRNMFGSGGPEALMMHPLGIRLPGQEHDTIRTILTVDESDQSLSFAGDIPEGMTARFLKSSKEKLIDAAADAARTSCQPLNAKAGEFSFLVSCFGRNALLQERVDEEVQTAQRILGQGTVTAGFYSYGAIAPFSSSFASQLHNQSMNITTFLEV